MQSANWPSIADSTEEERREVLDCVIEAIRCGTSDADEMAACTYLVHHLVMRRNSRFG